MKKHLESLPFKYKFHYVLQADNVNPVRFANVGPVLGSTLRSYRPKLPNFLKCCRADTEML